MRSRVGMRLGNDCMHCSCSLAYLGGLSNLSQVHCKCKL